MGRNPDLSPKQTDKHPLCVGEARRIVLDALGTRYQQRFTDQWDFVRYAKERNLGLDLTTPPKGR